MKNPLRIQARFGKFSVKDGVALAQIDLTFGVGWDVYDTSKIETIQFKVQIPGKKVLTVKPDYQKYTVRQDMRPDRRGRLYERPFSSDINRTIELRNTIVGDELEVVLSNKDLALFPPAFHILLEIREPATETPQTIDLIVKEPAESIMWVGGVSSVARNLRNRLKEKTTGERSEKITLSEYPNDWSAFLDYVEDWDRGADGWGLLEAMERFPLYKGLRETSVYLVDPESNPSSGPITMLNVSHFLDGVNNPQVLLGGLETDANLF